MLITYDSLSWKGQSFYLTVLVIFLGPIFNAFQIDLLQLSTTTLASVHLLSLRQRVGRQKFRVPLTFDSVTLKAKSILVFQFTSCPALIDVPHMLSKTFCIFILPFFRGSPSHFDYTIVEKGNSSPLGYLFGFVLSSISIQHLSGCKESPAVESIYTSKGTYSFVRISIVVSSTQIMIMVFFFLLLLNSIISRVIQIENKAGAIVDPCGIPFNGVKYLSVSWIQQKKTFIDTYTISFTCSYASRKVNESMIQSLSSESKAFFTSIRPQIDFLSRRWV